MSNEFLLRNLKTITRRNKQMLAALGYLKISKIVNSEGRIQKYEFELTLEGNKLLGIEVEEKSSTLKFCSACGKGHWRKNKQFCSEDCKQEKKHKEKQKRLDYDQIMADIRAKKVVKEKEIKEKKKTWYVNNREKMSDYQKDYRFRKQQEQFTLTVLTTTI